MTNTYRVLGQLDPSAATATTLYTVPGSTSAILSGITVTNRSATATSYRVAIRPAGAALDPKHYIAYDVAIPGNTQHTLPGGIGLATTDVVTVYATLATVAFNAFGVEIT